MKAKSFSPMGSLHPILFFAVVYIVALIASVFICSSLFYTFNGGSGKLTGQQETVKPEQKVDAGTTIALR